MRIDGNDTDTSGISVFRIEAKASVMLHSQNAPGSWETTPGGLEVLLQDQGAGYQSANWYVGANVMIQVNVHPATGLDILDVVDDVNYEAASPPCVVAELIEPYPVCAEVEGREVVFADPN
jgi:hypothetical protein